MYYEKLLCENCYIIYVCSILVYIFATIQVYRRLSVYARGVPTSRVDFVGHVRYHFPSILRNGAGHFL